MPFSACGRRGRFGARLRFLALAVLVVNAGAHEQPYSIALDAIVMPGGAHFGAGSGGTVRVLSRKGAANLYTGRTVARGPASTDTHLRAGLVSFDSRLAAFN